MAVYEFDNYAEYLDDIVRAHQQDRGYKSKLARAAKVHPSLITRILDGRALLTVDQGAALAEFWGLNSEEKEYFHWLVLKARASDPALKQLVGSKLERMREENSELGKSLSAEKIEPGREDTYYLHWIYSAMHMLGTLPGMTLAKARERLGQPEILVHAAARALAEQGFIAIEKGDRFHTIKTNVHTSNQGWLSLLHHRNWRVATLDRIGRPGVDDVRYTGAHSLSRRDFERLKRNIKEFLLQTDQLIRPSPEETVGVLCLDLFEI